jgi:hypothetical protein
MTITELITALETIRTVAGDLPVVSEFGEFFDYDWIAGAKVVDVTKDGDKPYENDSATGKAVKLSYT